MKRGDYIHKEHPKTRAEDDFWGQVCRTVKGVPVPQDQIDMIVCAIRKALQFEESDVLLDIGCGNGALSQYFFGAIRGFQGVDFSEYLIEIARKYFEQEPNHVFTEMDALDFLKQASDRERYTKLLCYGAFTYFPEDTARAILSELRQGYPRLGRVFIGNLPDTERADLFFKDRDQDPVLDDHLSPTGIWRSRNQFAELARDTGWDIAFSQMPGEFFAASYRYDALLTRDQGRPEA